MPIYVPRGPFWTPAFANYKTEHFSQSAFQTDINTDDCPPGNSIIAQSERDFKLPRQSFTKCPLADPRYLVETSSAQDEAKAQKDADRAKAHKDVPVVDAMTGTAVTIPLTSHEQEVLSRFSPGEAEKFTLLGKCKWEKNGGVRLQSTTSDTSGSDAPPKLTLEQSREWDRLIEAKNKVLGPHSRNFFRTASDVQQNFGFVHNNLSYLYSPILNIHDKRVWMLSRINERMHELHSDHPASPVWFRKFMKSKLNLIVSRRK